ncbi:MAG: hypothetical protein LIP03_08000 [Bacteroidales bacterium]|nr:hypothetical protein [Bacteroidales bacterium]
MSSEEQRRPNNPFVVGRYVGGEYFCDREEETRFMLKFIQRHSLDTASSVQSALRPLLKSDLVTQADDSYQLSDFFLSQWLKENY